MQRPTSVLVLGILNLLFALLGLCGAVVGIFGLAVIHNMDRGGERVPLGLRLMQENEMYRVFSFASIGLGVLATLVLAISGIGLLKLRPWGRTLSIIYGVYGILSSIAGLAINLMVYAPALEEAQHGADPQATAEAMSGMVGSGVAGCFGLIYPGVLLGFMLFRPSIREAFGVDGNRSEVMDIPDDNPYSDPMS